MYCFWPSKWRELLHYHIVKNNENGMSTPTLTNNLKGNNYGNMKKLKNKILTRKGLMSYVSKHSFSYLEMQIEYLF